MYGGKQICPIFFIKPSQIVVNALKTLENFSPYVFLPCSCLAFFAITRRWAGSETCEEMGGVGAGALPAAASWAEI